MSLFLILCRATRLWGLPLIALRSFPSNPLSATPANGRDHAAQGLLRSSERRRDAAKLAAFDEATAKTAMSNWRDMAVQVSHKHAAATQPLRVR
jgi:hypothetical protein